MKPHIKEFSSLPKLPVSLTPRGISRIEAAAYVGVSQCKFDEMVGDHRMPAPKRIDGRKVWDVRDLDLAFDTLPYENGPASKTTWDDFRQS
jgi:predicted DNA-binding transcriptional regulator AlpA